MVDFRYFQFLFHDLDDFHINQISIDEFLQEVVVTLDYSIEVFDKIYELGRHRDDSTMFTYDPKVEVYNGILKARFPYENIQFVYEKFYPNL